MSLPYTALDLAVLLSLRDLGIREVAALLDTIWAEERDFLAPDLVKSKRAFLLDVAYQLQPYLRGAVPCKLSEISIDEMVVFRLYETDNNS